MNNETVEIKKGIKLHQIQTNKFKTNLLAVFLSLPLTKETVTKNALIAAVLRRGTAKMHSQEMISQNLEEMYGATFDCGIEKTGDNHTIKFYLEAINDQFLPEKEDLLRRGMDLLLDIIFNPYIEKEMFKEEYVEGEKQNLKQIIEGKIDSKDRYAIERCVEEMYKDKPYGLYKFGYIEDIEKITSKELYDYYKTMIQECKIDIFVSGDIKENITQDIEKNENIQKLIERELKLLKDEDNTEVLDVKKVTESMQVTQGKLVLGLQINGVEKEESYVGTIYNTILGVGANSKLFQNVREKESLAYTCGSNYIKRKQLILVRAGIEIKNEEKALEIIQKQLDDMKNGDFSEEDIGNSKNLILSTIDNITEEQDTEISYYFGQELSNNFISVEEYRSKIQDITKEQVQKIASKVKVDTIYFLRD